MSSQRRKQRLSRYPWSLLGLLLVALFVAHDMVMASEAGATPGHETNVSHHISGRHLRTGALSLPHGFAPEPEHPRNCGIGQFAVPPNGDDFDPVDQSYAAIVTISLSSAPACGRHYAVAWEEPHWPPGTLRALWQVYRI
jgi:hypothetical protein